MTDDLRARTLRECHGSPILAAVSLTLGLGANRPDDGPSVRLGYSLLSAVASAVEIIGPPRPGEPAYHLDPALVAYMAVRSAARQGLILHDVPDTLAAQAAQETTL